MSYARPVSADELATAAAWVARMSETPVDAWDFKPPTYRSIPEWKWTLGPEVGRICAAAGMKPDPEQQLALDGVFSYDPLDPYGASPVYEVAIISSRQAMKTGAGKMMVLGWLFHPGVKDPDADKFVVTWSAHELSTSLETFEDLVDLIEKTPALRRLMPPPGARDPIVGGIRRKNGDVRIRTADGRECRFKARTNDGGRGLTGDKIVLDESFALTESHMGALLPTLTVVPNAQIVYLSSAGKLKSSVLREIRDRGRFGGDPSLLYLEWCAEVRACRMKDVTGELVPNPECPHPRPGTRAWEPGMCALDDEDLWAQAYPLLGRKRANGSGLTVEKLRGFRRSEPSNEWMRERLGWWDDPGASTIFGAGNWEACEHPIPEDSQPTSFGVAVGYNLSEAAIVAAAGTKEEPIVRVLHYGPNIHWVVDALAELRRKYPGARFIIDAAGPSGAILAEIKAHDYEKPGDGVIWPETPRVVDLLDATSDFYRAVTRRKLTHEGDPELTAAVAGAARRNVRDRWLWGRTQSDSEISPLEAATLAVWGLGDAARGRDYAVSGVETV